MQPGEPEPPGFDFPGYLALWLYQLHMPERDFWKTMTPRRLLATLCRPEKAQPEREPRRAVSLAEYLGGT